MGVVSVAVAELYLQLSVFGFCSLVTPDVFISGCLESGFAFMLRMPNQASILRPKIKVKIDAQFKKLVIRAHQLILFGGGGSEKNISSFIVRCCR